MRLQAAQGHVHAMQGLVRLFGSTFSRHIQPSPPDVELPKDFWIGFWIVFWPGF